MTKAERLKLIQLAMPYVLTKPQQRGSRTTTKLHSRRVIDRLSNGMPDINILDNGYYPINRCLIK